MKEEHLSDFNTLIKKAKRINPTGQKVKVAILSDTAIQFFAKAINAMAKLNNLNIETFEADYDQIDLQILSPDSDLYTFESNIIIIYQSYSKLKKQFYKTDLSEKECFSKKFLKQIEQRYAAIQNQSTSKVFYLNFPLINDSVFGQFAGKTNCSLLYQLHTINIGLSELAQKNGNLYVADLQSLTAFRGTSKCYNKQLEMSADMEFDCDFLPILSGNIIDIVLAILGNFKKCVILDLDNTLWGGIIGDDGLNGIQVGELGIGKAFSSFQLWLKQLKERGIILAVCSKNTEAIALEPFQKHPEMILKEEDFAIFVANWNNKADNIRYIQKVLNIGFDSMVFIDDNPFERNLVRENIPEVCVPELPIDPAEYEDYLASLNLFETISFNHKDSNRNQQYREEAQRKTIEIQFTNQDDYLNNLNMKAIVEPFNSYSTPRVAQLTQRSNQFNLRTVRYTEEDIKRIELSDKYVAFTVSLSDKYGEYGLISLIILEDRKESYFINTWIMSCRVLKRGVEDFVLNEMANLTKVRDKKYLIGEYLPTKKNGIVKDLYPSLGFIQVKDLWQYEVNRHQISKYFIKKNNSTI